MDDDLHEFASRVLAAQPFSQLLGATLSGIGPGGAEITLPITVDLSQQHGYVHGGVISYLADNTITFADGLTLGSDALTSECKINFPAPATGTTLIARADTDSIGSRQAVCRTEIFTADGHNEQRCALAQGTVISLTRTAAHACLDRTCSRTIREHRGAHHDQRWRMPIRFRGVPVRPTCSESARMLSS